MDNTQFTLGAFYGTSTGSTDSLAGKFVHDVVTSKHLPEDSNDQPAGTAHHEGDSPLVIYCVDKGHERVPREHSSRPDYYRGTDDYRVALYFFDEKLGRAKVEETVVRVDVPNGNYWAFAIWPARHKLEDPHEVYIGAKVWNSEGMIVYDNEEDIKKRILDYEPRLEQNALLPMQDQPVITHEQKKTLLDIIARLFHWD